MSRNRLAHKGNSSKRKTFTDDLQDRLSAQHAESIEQFTTSKAGKGDSRGSSARLFLVDVLLIFVLTFLILALMVIVQAVGAATIDVALASSNNAVPISQIIFTSAVVGGLCGAVLTWAPRLFLYLRRAVRNKIDKR